MEVSAQKDVKSETVANCGYRLYLRSEAKQLADLDEAVVKIDGKEHVFRLGDRPSARAKCPELRDSDTKGTPIRDFLARRNFLTWTTRKPPRFELKPLAPGRFELR